MTIPKCHALLLHCLLTLCLVIPEANADTAQSQNPSAQTLRIASWNLAWLGSDPNNKRRQRDYRQLSRYASELNADVIALQEVENAKWASKVLGGGYDYYFSSRDASQRVGFAVRQSLPLQRHWQEYRALDTGNLRYGLDLTLSGAQGSLRLLAVHLKSGCFRESLAPKDIDKMPVVSSKQRYRRRSCDRLREQIKPLERWIDRRAAEGQAFVVLGDFNRQLTTDVEREYGEREGLWQALDDSGAEALWTPALNKESHCWGGRHRQYIDYILLGTRAQTRYVPKSFRQLLYREPYQRERARRLSDHCPISIELNWL